MVTGEYPLEEFETALARFAEGEEQKVVLYFFRAAGPPLRR
ncbi:MAG: hypothetical protein R3F30_07840 [Planctomycetota bacterium]